VAWLQKNFTKLVLDKECRAFILSADSVTHVEELITLIQKDPQLWEILEQLKHQDEAPEDFILSVAQMLSIEFEELHRTDLSDKLAALFGGLPEQSMVMVPLLLHIALDIFLMRAVPNHQKLREM
jgi:hypothetical protein